jgi:hypothetical protein
MRKILEKNKNKTGEIENFSTLKNTGSTNKKRAWQRPLQTGALVVASLGVFVFCVWYIGYQMRSPFETTEADNSNSNTSQTVRNTNQITAVVLEDLKNKDTDGDGLSDYQELYTTKTSPYIADSDSDGVSDKAEVDRGTDPNCPEGATCYRQVALTNSNTNTTIATSNTNTQSTSASSLTPDQLRAVLRNAGASEDKLKSIPDDMLLQTYQEVINDQSTSNTNQAANTNISTTNAATNSTIDINSITTDDLKSLSIADIRQILIESGVPKNTLDQVDDATLQQIYNDSLTQNLQDTSTSQ